MFSSAHFLYPPLTALPESPGSPAALSLSRQIPRISPQFQLLTVPPESPESPAALFPFPPVSPAQLSPQRLLPALAPLLPLLPAQSAAARRSAQWDPHAPYRDTAPRSPQSDVVPLPAQSALLRYSNPEAVRWHAGAPALFSVLHHASLPRRWLPRSHVSSPPKCSAHP